MTASLTAREARALAAGAAASPAAAYARGREGAEAFLRGAGYIQIDTISVVARAHEHVLWTRTGRYGPQPFRDLEGADGRPRAALEYWAHAAAYLPAEDFRFCLPRIERIAREGHEWFGVDREAAAAVLDRIRAEGPLSSKDFEDPRSASSGWWDWKPAKRALEYLFHAGEVLVATRTGFNKVFDLRERVLGAGVDPAMPTGAELAAHFVDRAAGALGCFQAEDVAYGRKDGAEAVPAELAARLEDGRLAAFGAEGLPSPCLAEPAAIEPALLSAAGRDAAEPRAWVLSPFDPFLIDRRRLRRLFGFDFAIECYLPAAKRTFGYFALPVFASGPLARDRFAGLVDAKAERKEGLLRVRRIALGEAAGAPWFRGAGTADLARAIGAAVAAFARLNGVEEVVFERVEAPGPRAEAALRAGCAAALARPSA